ncbi:MAG: signal peptide peptidase SppA [Syntrophomonadaceae bacterium]|nr:signal peptide peptidase SppA [Syntrophomonadaceae bacterium]
MNAKRWMALIVFAVLCVAWFNIDSTPAEISEIESVKWMEGWDSLLAQGPGFITEYDYIGSDFEDVALIHLKGTILDYGDYATSEYRHGALLQALADAYGDPQVAAIVLAVDSPGGGVYECDEVYQTVKELQELYPKPLVVSMESMAASAAYYISMTADELFAQRMTMTGSIGVISSYLNMAELAEKMGLSVEVYKSGAVKDMNSGWRSSTPEEAAINQALIDEYFGFFVDVVAEGRDMEREKVLELADGRVYTALQALELDLIDAIGDRDAAVARAGELAGLTDPSVREYSYTNNFWNYMWTMSASLGSPQWQQTLLNDLNQPRALYLYTEGAI